MAIDLGEVTGLNASKEKKKDSVKIANGLDKDAFMKLFLEQLKNQDPTAPMETDKIIAQTAQLTQVEMQEENKKTMKEVASTMKEATKTNQALQEFQVDMKKSLQLLNEGMQNSTNATLNASKISSLNAMGMIGKIAETNINGIDINGSGINNFSLYFDNKIDASKGSPAIEILNQNKEIVKTISLSDKDGQEGYINFSWDGKDKLGNAVPRGNYTIIANYNLDSNNKYESTRLGRGMVQSIIYEKGAPLLRMENNILPLSSAVEFYQKGEKSQFSNSLDSLKAQASKALGAEMMQNKISQQENDINTTSSPEKQTKDMHKKDSNRYEKMLDEAVKNRKQIDEGEFANLNKSDSESKNISNKVKGNRDSNNNLISPKDLGQNSTNVQDKPNNSLQGPIINANKQSPAQTNQHQRNAQNIIDQKATSRETLQHVNKDISNSNNSDNLLSQALQEVPS